MEEKMRFVVEYEQSEHTMTELCERYHVSRETGYVWIRRYRAAGVLALCERDRAAFRHPNQTPAEIERRVLELRQAHMRWGPRKLKRILEREEPARAWPAASTMGAILRREGLVVPRRKRQRTAPYTQPLAHADGPNRVWCADFKGWFRTADGERIDPLTISDAHSRYLLRCQGVAKTDTEHVRAVSGLSRLAVWWMKLGIVPERIAAGHPEQNGRHERMHRTLKQEAAMPPAADRRTQQRALDRFREEYNQMRPHEALQMHTPASVYVPSARSFPARVAEAEYPETMAVRKVQQHGHFRWNKQEVFVSEVLWGERVGLLPVDDRWFTIYFAQFPIARLDSRHSRITPLPNATDFSEARAREGEIPPSPAPLPRNEEKQKLSGMSPAAHSSVLRLAPQRYGFPRLA